MGRKKERDQLHDPQVNEEEKTRRMAKDGIGVAEPSVRIRLGFVQGGCNNDGEGNWCRREKTFQGGAGREEGWLGSYVVQKKKEADGLWMSRGVVAKKDLGARRCYLTASVPVVGLAGA